MFSEETQQRIINIQKKKEELKIQVSKALKRSSDYYKLHKAAEQKYDKLKAEYEALDREEKFITLKITKKMLPTKKKASSTNASSSPQVEKAIMKNKAIKAFNNLDEATRAKLINQFKGA